jgi:predicted NAD/FAD-binding protein
MQTLKIAVVGSGISGLSAAWLLSQRHEVTLIEAEQRIGGHSNTVDVSLPEGRVAVDTGFIVYNDFTYPNLAALFDYLAVPTAKSSMGFAVSLHGGDYEYSGEGVLQLLGHASNIANFSHWRMIAGLTRFFRTASQSASHISEDVSLAEFLQTNKYSADFVNLHLLPVAAAIWSSEPSQMLQYPARAFMRFFENHGLLSFTNRPQWRTVAGGSREYVQRLLDDSRMRVVKGCAIHSVSRSKSGVEVRGAQGYAEEFDHVVLATHADTALAMLEAPGGAEARLLSTFKYSQNLATLHRDPRFMPRRRRMWSSWNCVSDGDVIGNQASVTYWMNALQPLPTATNLFVSINARAAPEPQFIEQEIKYAHPIFTTQTRKAQTELWSLQGQNRTWYCGAHFGAGFHEDGLQAGLAVAEQLGGLVRPWTVAGKSDRIFVPDLEATG